MSSAHESKKIFADKTIHVDGSAYQACHFIRCKLIYSGGEAPRFNDCVFDPLDLRFEGHAGNTLGLLKALAHPSSGFQEVMLDIFSELVSGTGPRSRAVIRDNVFDNVGGDAIRAEGYDETVIEGNMGSNIGGHGVVALGPRGRIPQELISEIHRAVAAGSTPVEVERAFGSRLRGYGLDLAAALGVAADSTTLLALLIGWPGS